MKLEEGLGVFLQDFFNLKAPPRSTQSLKELSRNWDFGLWLTSDQGVVCKQVAGKLIDGKSLSKANVIRGLGQKIPNAQQVMDRLLKSGIIEEKDGKIVRSMFIASKPTKHKVVANKGGGAFVWCAADALALALMLGRDLWATSSCPVCEREISVRVEKERIASAEPQETVLLLGMKKQAGAVLERICPYTNFFCSDRHLQKWLTNQEGIVGARLSLDKGLHLFRMMFPRT